MDSIISTEDQGLGYISNWESKSKGLHEQYPLLSDTDLHYEEGNENELLCRIETRLNISRDEVILILQKDRIIVADD